jgi:YidC/Oxa1 family membrane protein insertase
MIGVIGDVFTPVLIDPMMNFLIILNNVLFGSFGLAIIAFTIIIRLVTFPLTRRQLHASRAMQQVQPRIQEINKKYSDPKRRQEEMMKLYKEAGVNPLGCLGPMLLQFPILIALFYAIRQTLPESPESLEGLSSHLYNWSYIQHAIPLNEFFLGIDLKLTPNDAPSYFHPAWLLVLLVGITTWAQTKTTVTTTTDERARAQQQMMAYMMPVMFAFFALSFPSGVSLYWVVNSLIGIGFNIVTYGLPWLKIEPLLKAPTPAPAAALASRAATPSKSPSEPVRELRTANGPGRSKRQNRRRRP